MTRFYQIRVRGHLSDKRAECFGGLTIENQPNGGALISGPAADQAALHGLLIGVRDLGLPLLSVICIESGFLFGMKPTVKSKPFLVRVGAKRVHGVRGRWLSNGDDILG